MIHPDEMWDEPESLIEDDEPAPTLRVIPAPAETVDQRLERDRKELEAEFRRTFPDTTYYESEAA